MTAVARRHVEPADGPRRFQGGGRVCRDRPLVDVLVAMFHQLREGFLNRA